MLCYFLIPSAVLELYAAGLLGGLSDDDCPGLCHFFVGVVLVPVVLIGIPVGQAVDDVGGPVQESERGGGLLFVWGKEVGGEVFEGVEQLDELLAHAVVGVVGRRAAAKGEGGLERCLVLCQHLEGRLDAWARRRGHDFVADVWMALADGLQQIAHLVGTERLEQAWQGQGAARHVCAHALHAPWRGP